MLSNLILFGDHTPAMSRCVLQSIFAHHATDLQVLCSTLLTHADFSLGQVTHISNYHQDGVPQVSILRPGNPQNSELPRTIIRKLRFIVSHISKSRCGPPSTCAALEPDALRQRFADGTRVGGLQQPVPLLLCQFTVQIEIIAEDNFIGMSSIQAHIGGHAAQGNTVVIRIHTHRHIHTRRQGCLQQVVGPEAGVFPALVGSRVGDAFVFAVRE